jgi:uncharacterized protein
MSETQCTAFSGNRIFLKGTLTEVAAAVREEPQSAMIQVFDDTSGQVIDIDRRGSLPAPPLPAAPEEPKGRGRPKLGVVAREVTLLPRHWDWLSSQPGGASVALRKLVDQARHTTGDSERVRLAQEGAYRFMSAMGGNLPNFEEASRALFAYDRRRFSELLAAWPEDIRDYAINLAFADLTPADG